MKLLEAVLNKVKANKKKANLPHRALKLSLNSFLKMYSFIGQSASRSYSADLISKLVENWQKYLPSTYQVSIPEIYIDQAKLLKVDASNKQIIECTKTELLNAELEELAVSRAILKIVVKGIDASLAPAIAISISEKGETFAWGNRVDICSNFSIFNNRKSLFSTYNKREKLELDSILNRLYSYMEKTELEFGLDLKEIEGLKQKQISRKEFHRFLGEQLSQVAFVNYHVNNRSIRNLPEQEKAIIINSKQLSQIAVEAKSPSHSVYEWENESTDLWKVINYGTEILKFSNGSDLPSILNTNRKWVNLIKKYPFNLN